MKFILIARVPHDTFNAAVRDGTAGEKMDRILAETKPEAVYFTEMDGLRTVVMAVDLKDGSEIPFFAEPWFLTFGCDVEFHAAMTPEDLRKGDLGKMGKQWG